MPGRFIVSGRGPLNCADANVLTRNVHPENSQFRVHSADTRNIGCDASGSAMGRRSDRFVT